MPRNANSRNIYDTTRFRVKLVGKTFDDTSDTRVRKRKEITFRTKCNVSSAIINVIYISYF